MISDVFIRLLFRFPCESAHNFVSRARSMSHMSRLLTVHPRAISQRHSSRSSYASGSEAVPGRFLPCVSVQPRLCDRLQPRRGPHGWPADRVFSTPARTFVSQTPRDAAAPAAAPHRRPVAAAIAEENAELSARRRLPSAGARSALAGRFRFLRGTAVRFPRAGDRKLARAGRCG